MSKPSQIFHEMGFAPEEERLSEAVVYSIGRTFSLLNRQLAGVYARFGLTAASFNLLMLLKHGDDPSSLTQQCVGRRLVVSASDMTGLIDRLERKGLVRRIPGKDRRSNLLQITPKGSRLLDDVWPHHIEAIQRLGATLNRQEARQLVQSLDRLRQAEPA